MSIKQRRLQARSLILTLVMLATLSPAVMLSAGAGNSVEWDSEDRTGTDRNQTVSTDTEYDKITVKNSGGVELTVDAGCTLTAGSIDIGEAYMNIYGSGTTIVENNITSYNEKGSYIGALGLYGDTTTIVSGRIQASVTLNGGAVKAAGFDGGLYVNSDGYIVGDYNDEFLSRGDKSNEEKGELAGKLLSRPVACIESGESTVYYAALQDALTAASSECEEEQGKVTLMRDVTIDAALTVEAGYYVTLDLNGHVIDRALAGKEAADYGSVITVCGALTVKDSSVDDEHPFGEGMITGGSHGHGGGVYVARKASFTLEGGTVRGNAANVSGGGVYVESAAEFKMTGGAICGNAADFDGGGVCVGDGGKLIMSGGTISGNTAKDTRKSAGGGVYLDGGRLFISGSAKIAGNVKYAEGETAKNEDGLYTGGADDDLYMYTEGEKNAEIVVTGALTGGNKSVGVKSDVLGTFARASSTENEGESNYELNDTDAGYFFFNGEGVSVERSGSKLKLTTPWTRLQSLLDAAGKDGTVTLDRDYTMSARDRSLVIHEGVTVTLDLNGKTLTGNGEEDIIIVGDYTEEEEAPENNGELTLKDSVGGGKLTGGETGVSVIKGGTFNMRGGTVSNNIHGGVYVGGTFNLSGGEISGNRAITDSDYSGKGGGVYVGVDGEFIMSGGKITRNVADDGGGVLLSFSEESEETEAPSIFRMSGGDISDNVAETGGGVCFLLEGFEGGESIPCLFEVSGGARIFDNVAVDDVRGYTFKDGEDPKGTPQNILLQSTDIEIPYDEETVLTYKVHDYITVADALNDNALLGVTLYTTKIDANKFVYAPATGVITAQGTGGYKLKDADLAHFTSDAEGCAIALNADGEAYLGFDISKASVAFPTDTAYVYDGAGKEPEVTVTLGGETLTNDTDYTVSYSDNVSAGKDTAKVVVTGKGDYAGAAKKSFTISPASVTVTADNAGKAYGENDPAAFTATVTGTVGDDTVSYTVSRTAGESVGTYTITPTGDEKQGNYTVTYETGTFTIGAKSGAVTVTLPTNTKYVYNGSEHTPTVTVMLGETELKKDTDYTVSYSDNKNAGTAKITVSPVKDGNYSFTAVGTTFSIEKASQKLSFTDATVTKNSGDEPFTNALSGANTGVTYKTGNDKVATVDESGAVTIVGIGTATITATAAEGDNYLGGETSFTLTVEATGAKVRGDWRISTGKLSAKVVAPNGGTLIIAAYDRDGRLVRIEKHTVEANATEEQTVDTEIVKTAGYSYKVMLVDSDYVPLCKADSVTGE